MYNLHSPTKNKYKVEWKDFWINRLFLGKRAIDPREGKLLGIIYWKLLYDYLWPPFFFKQNQSLYKFVWFETKKLIMKNGNTILNYIFIGTNNYLFIITWMPQNSYTYILFWSVVGTASKTEVWAFSPIPIKIKVSEIIVL